VLTPFQAVEDLNALNLQNIFTGFYAILDDAVEIAAIVAAEAALLDTRMIADILPAFQYGMRDMGAVLTTGFTIGEANMRARDNLSVAKLDAELRLQSRRVGWQLAIQWVGLVSEWERQIVGLATEVAVRYMEARFKADQIDVEIAAKDTLFDLDTYQYGSNVMASISGAVVRGQGGTSGISAALGNAVSGMSAGAKLGVLVGQPAAGAGIGALLGLAESIF